MSLTTTESVKLAEKAPKRMHTVSWRPVVLIGLVWLLLATVLVSASMGAVEIPFSSVVGVVLYQLGFESGLVFTQQHEMVLMSIRFPRVLMSAVVGAGLALAGAGMQGLFRNPLVEPGLLGVSGGAALFAVLGIVFGASLLGGAFAALGNYLIPALSFTGGLLVTLFAYTLSKVGSKPSAVLLILAGVAVNALTGALIGLVIYQASDAQIRDFTFWSLGSLGGITWQKVGISSLMILLPGYLMARQYKALNALALGEAEAFHLGVHVEKTRFTVIALSAVMVGGAVAFTGIIGFIGLIVPHLVRLVLGADHRVVLPASLLAGAILLTGADTLARMVVQPAELPIGIVTALLGSPFFIWLLISKRKQIIF